MRSGPRAHSQTFGLITGTQLEDSLADQRGLKWSLGDKPLSDQKRTLEAQGLMIRPIGLRGAKLKAAQVSIFEQK